MKFTASVADFRKALTSAMSVIPRTPTLAVFSGVQIAATRKQAATAGRFRVEVTGSAEQETTVTAFVDATGVDTGAVVVAPGPLLKYLAALPGSAAVDVSSDSKTRMSVQVEGAPAYTFRVMDATFPTSPLAATEVRAANLSRLGSALAAVAACAKETRVVQLVSDEFGLALHATDGKRLARAHLAEASFDGFSGLLQLDALKSVADEELTGARVDRRGRAITFEGPHVQVTTRLIDETYPPVGALLDAEPPYSAVVPVRELRSRLARIDSVAFAKRPLVVEIGSGVVTLRMDSIDVGTGVETIDLVEPGPYEITFAVNLSYLLAAIAAGTGEDVVIRWSTPEAAVFVHHGGDMPVTVVIMPVRME